ncbi:MAG: toprim domain-containing protein [Rhodoferax sp.]
MSFTSRVSFYPLMGEGSSEELVLPQLAHAMAYPTDRSFVAIIPSVGGM